MSRVMVIRIDDDLAGKLDELAAALDRPKSWLIERAIVSYVADRSWPVRAISEALDAYRGGSEILASHQAVIERVEARLRSQR